MAIGYADILILKFLGFFPERDHKSQDEVKFVSAVDFGLFGELIDQLQRIGGVFYDDLKLLEGKKARADFF